MDVLELGTLGLDEGGHLLVKRALRQVPDGGELAVHGKAPALAVHLRALCRQLGVDARFPESGPAAVLRRSPAADGRWRFADRAGEVDAVSDGAEPTWGLAARGARVERGGPAFRFPLRERAEIWAEEAGRLYAQAAAAQWDPATAIPWDASFTLPGEVEDAVVQVMTYLIENETAALLVPARFASQVHPHYREVLQLLAIQAADEARHIEVFTRRALLVRDRPGLSTVGGQASLETLVSEGDFAVASFLLSVLGEGSFLSLLWFLHEHAPDPVTHQIAKLTAQDEARHVAFGIAHLARHAAEEPALLERLAAALERRHDALAHTAGLNEEVFDALLVLAAGSFEPEAIRAGFHQVQALEREMDEGRRRRLVRLGFAPERAAALSALHTRNFM